MGPLSLAPYFSRYSRHSSQGTTTTERPIVTGQIDGRDLTQTCVELCQTAHAMTQHIRAAPTTRGHASLT